MNTSVNAAIQEYKSGNSLPLIQVLRETLKNEPALCDFLVLAIQKKVKLKPGPKPGRNEKRDRQLAARMVELMRTEPYLKAAQDLMEESGLSEGTIARAYSKYATVRKSRPRS